MSIHFNSKKRVIAFNAILFAALFGLVTLNKKVLRPAFTQSELLKILTGCFPNFIAAYLIAGAAVVAVLVRRFKHHRVIVYSSSIAVSAILIIEELNPIWGASEHYDTYDIIASLVGSFFAIMTFEIFHRIRKKQESI